MSTWEIISLSLLTRTENLDTSKPTPQQFLLVMCDWTDNNDKENEDSQPPKKKMRKDLSCKVAAKDHFAESSSDVEYAK